MAEVSTVCVSWTHSSKCRAKQTQMNNIYNAARVKRPEFAYSTEMQEFSVYIEIIYCSLP